jgi:hypothetical protein
MLLCRFNVLQHCHVDYGPASLPFVSTYSSAGKHLGLVSGYLFYQSAVPPALRTPINSCQQRAVPSHPFTANNERQVQNGLPGGQPVNVA